MLRRRLILTLLLVAAVFSNVIITLGTAEAQQYKLSKYYPLKQGITWIYLQTYGDGAKNYETFCVGGTETFNGTVAQKRWEFDSGEVGYFDHDYNAQAWTKEGLKVFKGAQSDGYYSLYSPPSIVFPAKMSLGETFRHSSIHTRYDPEGNVVNTEDFTIEVTFIGVEDVTVRAGRFTKCLKFSVREFDEGEWTENTFWLATGVGKVKSVNVDGDIIELLAYTKGSKTYYPVE